LSSNQLKVSPSGSTFYTAQPRPTPAPEARNKLAQAGSLGKIAKKIPSAVGATQVSLQLPQSLAVNLALIRQARKLCTSSCPAPILKYNCAPLSRVLPWNGQEKYAAISKSAQS
jgi:hypothetical protein